jgi:hypothetical protein
VCELNSVWCSMCDWKVCVLWTAVSCVCCELQCHVWWVAWPVFVRAMRTEQCVCVLRTERVYSVCLCGEDWMCVQCVCVCELKFEWCGVCVVQWKCVDGCVCDEWTVCGEDWINTVIVVSVWGQNSARGEGGLNRLCVVWTDRTVCGTVLNSVGMCVCVCELNSVCVDCTVRLY